MHGALLDRQIWKLLALGPALFLTFLAAETVVRIAAGVDPSVIPDQVAGSMARVLLAVQIFLLLSLAVLWRLSGEPIVRLGWSIPRGRRLVADTLIGAVTGVLLAAAYFRLFAPSMAFLQRTFGDYVPPGELLPVLSSDLGTFFLANVVLAPVVEETLYRGYALPRLRARFGPRLGVVLSCLFFGLLHWPGGVWYIVLTGAVAGGVFAGLFLWRGGIIAPFVAHLVLNAIEFASTMHAS